MSARLAIISEEVGVVGTPVWSARCYSCGAWLATLEPTVGEEVGLELGPFVRLPVEMVQRPERHAPTGLLRFGMPRRQGHDPRERRPYRTLNAASRNIGQHRAIYVNCPNCDRGQVVRWL